MNDDFMGRRATSADVARLAGVSRTTVSEIFNGRGDRFPEDTRNRVRAAAAQLRYSPSPAARTLKTGRSKSVLLVVPNLSTGGEFTGIIDGIGSVVGRLGFHLAIQFAPQHSPALLDEILRLHPAGVIDLGVLGADTHSALRASGVIVVPDARDSSNADFQRQIGRLMMEVLLEHPDRHYFYAGSAELTSSRYDPVRLAGMREVADRAGAQQPSQIDIRLTVDDATAVLAPLSRTGSIGVGCYTDTVAMAVIAGARRLGLRVPDDVAVVGVDGSIEGQLVSPRLTSVEVDGRLVGAEVAESLLRAVTDSPTPSQFDSERAIRVIRGESA